MTMRRILLLLLLLLPAAAPAAPFYYIEHFGVRDGLSDNHVVSIAEDKDGFIWFATEEGLNRFDGTHFRSYFKDGGNAGSGITGNELNCLLDDPEERILWIGTQRAGLNAYDYSTHRFITYRHDDENPGSLGTDDITWISPAKDGNLWICTYWKGIDLFDKDAERFTHFNNETIPGFPGNSIWTATDGGDGRLYIGHVNNGLTVLDIKDLTFKNYVHDPEDRRSLPDNEIRRIFIDGNDNIWVGTGRGLALFNREEGNFIRIDDKDGRFSRRIYDIGQDKETNRLWVAMESGGIAIIDLSSQFISHSDSIRADFIMEGDDDYGLSSASIRCLLKDSYGNIWAGSWGGGINFIHREPEIFYTVTHSLSPSSDNNLSTKNVMGMCVDKKGDLWVGTDGAGVDIFRDGHRVHSHSSDNQLLRNSIVQTAMCDSEGNVWLGLFYGGIIRHDARTGAYRQVFPAQDATTDVRAFNEGGNGDIYVATSDGIYVTDKAGRTIKDRFDAGNNLARCIQEDDKGRIWTGFFGDGLGIYDSGMKLLHKFSVDNGFPSNTVNYIFKDSRKRMWVASGEGLVCFPDYSRAEYFTYGRQQGLANAHIHAIGEDRDGNIWVSTNKGISCLDNEGTFSNFDHNDNLPAGSFSSGSIATDTEGNFYFGSISGMCSFRPETALLTRTPPEAHITGIEIHGTAEKPETSFLPFTEDSDPITLKYNHNNFSIRFNVRNHALRSRVEYSYTMKGLDNSWYILDGPRDATFRNLPPGKYELGIRTRMRNQEWSDRITTIGIDVRPPVWLTWWAKLIYIMIAGCVLFSLLATYIRRLNAETLYKIEKQSRENEQELNNERMRFYTNITHELRTPLTLIIGPLEDLEKSSSLARSDVRKVSVIRQSAERLLNLINQIMEFRKIESRKRRLCVCRADIVSLIYETVIKYRELSHNNGLEISFSAQPERIMMYFDKEIILTTLDNLISNALKYTDKGSVRIGVGIEGGNTVITVSDTGYGISADALPHIFDRYYQEGGKHQASGTGIGLSLVKSLIELHEGTITVESTQGKGSTFRVSLLTGNTYPEALHADAPAESAVENAEKEETAGQEEQRPILLVVEDNADICDYIADSLSDIFDVRKAYNGRQGLEAAQKLIPDMIVSDVMMPVMDGNEMCRAIRKDVRTSHIPIIMLTAKDSMSDKEEGYRDGADSYLTKPFSASLLRSRIDNLIQSRRILAEHFSAISTADSKAEIMARSMNRIDNEFIRKVDKAIEERLSSDKIDIGYLADRMCMSSSTLYRKMKALTGLSTNEYIRKVRMQFAERYLLEGSYNISEIASKVGFSNLFYFRQCFREEFGCNPSEYIKGLKGKTKE